MRRFFSFLFLICISLFIVDTLTQATLIRSSGSPGGSSGSPGVGGQTCTSCHGGTASSRTDIITTNIPAEGYTPGTQYTITVTLSEALRTTYGFEVRAEVNFESVGTMLNISTAETKILSPGTNNESATHKSTSISAPSGTKVWQWFWTAPPAGTGEVTFYGAFNAANGNGGSSGDIILRSQISVPEFIVPCSIQQKNVVANADSICSGTEVNITLQQSEIGIEYYLRDASDESIIDGPTVGDGSNLTFSHIPSGSITYQVFAVKDIDCEEIMDIEVLVTVIDFPLVTIFSPDSIKVCEGESVQFFAETTADSYSWVGPSGFVSNDLEPLISDLQLANSGEYILQGSNSGLCNSSDTLFLDVVETDLLSLDTHSLTICENEQVLLAATSSADSIIWNGTDTTLYGETHTLQGDTNHSGEYIVQTSGFCPAEDTFLLVVNANPQLDLEITPESACEGQPVTFQSNSNADSIHWLFPNTLDTNVFSFSIDSVTLDDSGKYMLNAFLKGCHITDSITLEVSEQLNPKLNFSDTIFKCTEDTLVISTGSYANYLWSTGDTSQAISIIGNSTELVSVQVSNGNDCEGTSDSLQVKTYVVEPPTLTFDTVCSGDTTLLKTESSYESFAWSNGATEPQISIITADSFSVVVSDTNGCLAESAYTQVEFYSLPSTTIEQVTDDSLVIIESGFDIQWYRNDTSLLTETRNGLKAFSSGVYYAEVIDTATGCSSFTESFVITVSKVESISDNGLLLYPTWVDSYLHFSGVSSTTSIVLVDLSGKTMKRFVIHQNQLLVNLESLSPGMYAVQWTDDNGNSGIEKIMKR